MSNVKSIIRGIGVIALACVLTSVGGIRACGRLAKGAKAAKAAKAADRAYDISRAYRATNAIKNAKNSEILTNALSHVKDVKTLADVFIIDEKKNSISDVNTTLYKSGLGKYFTGSITDTFYVDSIHRFQDLNIYVPEMYSIYEYYNNKDVLQLSYGIERIRLSTTMLSITSKNKAVWLTNKNGIKYRSRSYKYQEELLEYSYYIESKKQMYKLYFAREISNEKDIPKYIHRLEALIQLIEDSDTTTITKGDSN